MTGQNTPGLFKKEIIECLIEHLTDIPSGNAEEKKIHASRILKEAFTDSGGDYERPTYKSLIEAMKTLAVREMKNKKNSKIIANNFMRIVKKIKAVEYKENYTTDDYLQ